MASNDSFVHLHVHTEYSMLDGAARVKQLIKAAKELEMPAIAITDHGNTFGAYDFYKTATAQGIKPIIGIEAYVAPGETKRQERVRVKWADGGEDDVSGGGAFTHMTVLAENNTGMFNLFRMSSLASIEGFYFKPRFDRELFEQYGKGIIATTGCAGGEVQTLLRIGDYKRALETAAWYRDVLGKDNYFVEIMDHGIDVERRSFADLIKLSRELGIGLVATNDLHYTHPSEADSHDALLAIQVGSTLDDPNRFRFSGGPEYYLKTAKQMRELFADYPEACDNTLLIAERVDVKFEKRDLMPQFPLPPGETEETWFEKEVMAGLKRRYPNGVPEASLQQAKYEINVILNMKFPGYFLVVADFIAWARAQGIRVGPGRGSAAGSMVAYAMGITELDPIEHGLIFERFLNPDRISMPDIDVDFDDRRRPEVIQYVTQKYGDDRVAQIVTYGTIKAKQALKDATRILAMPYSVGEKLTKAMPGAVMGREATLTEMVEPPESKEAEETSRYKEGTEFRALLETDPDSAEVFKLARGIENLKRQWGVHAAGVVISAEPLLDVVPIMKREDDGVIITQFDQPPLDDLGLVKMDFLGLRNLTVLEDALELIQRNRGETVVLEELDLNADPKTYELLSRGDTLGVFQLDSPNMRSLLRQLKPTEFEHISAVIALYRPGPMGVNSHTNYALRKNGLQANVPIHPELEAPLAEVLGPTYGLIIYQEQVMSAAQVIAGFTLGQADLMRRAMGKKKKEELDKMHADFIAGGTAKGFSQEALNALWEVLVPFADYAFNKAHSAGYGVLSYWTGYLKANYPAEYMSALLTSVKDSKDKLGMYLNECRRMNLQVLPPDVNGSLAAFNAVEDDIRFGLEAIRGIGANVVEGIIQARSEKGDFKSFHDFLRKVPAVVCKRGVVEALIKAGAFDSLGHTRRSLHSIFEKAVDEANSLKKNETAGQVDLFGSLFEDESQHEAPIPELTEWPKREKLALEREMLGLYVSDHPLAGLESVLARYAETNTAELLTSQTDRDGQNVVLAGLITGVVNKVAKKSGNPYSNVTLEDFTGEISVMFMGKTFQQYVELLKPDQVVSVRGRVSARDDGYSINAFSLDVITAGAENEPSGPLVIKMSESEANRETMLNLNAILAAHPGNTEVQVALVTNADARPFRLPAKVRLSQDLFGELKALLGAAAVQ